MEKVQERWELFERENICPIFAIATVTALLASKSNRIYFHFLFSFNVECSCSLTENLYQHLLSYISFKTSLIPFLAPLHGNPLEKCTLFNSKMFFELILLFQSKEKKIF